MVFKFANAEDSFGLPPFSYLVAGDGATHAQRGGPPLTRNFSDWVQFKHSVSDASIAGNGCGCLRSVLVSGPRCGG